jgi:hypothetical protein
MQMRNATLVAACAVVALAGCAGKVSDQQRHVGKVAQVGAALAADAYGAQREKMVSLYDALGPAAPELLGKKGTYPVYRVQSAGDELVVASRETFRVGDCVEIRYPVSAGSRRQFDLGEAGMTKASGC